MPKTELVITAWEPYRRWWGGVRADVTIERRTYHGDMPGMYINKTIAQTTWRVPKGWSIVRLVVNDDGSVVNET
jgi:hypothetical protein